MVSLGLVMRSLANDFATLIPERLGPSGRVAVDTEDYVSALLRFSGGQRGCFSVSQTTAGSKSGVTVEIDGSLASANWEREKADILRVGRRDGTRDELRQGEGPSPDWETFRTEAQRGLVASFYTQILEGRRGSHADFADGNANVKVVAAMVASSRERGWKNI